MAVPRRIFYGWYVVAALCAISTVTSGLIFYNLSILLAAFTSERGFPVGMVSGATATFFIAGGIGGVIAGRLADRMDVRFVIGASAVVAALALASVGSLHEPWQLYTFHIVLGLSYGGVGLVPATTLITRWFNIHRAVALSVAFTGLSLGGILLAPLVALLIGQVGLAGAAPWMGLALFLGTVPLAPFLRPAPSVMGLEPDGVSRCESEQAAPQPVVSFAKARRSQFFYVVSAAYLFLLGAQVGAIAHLYRLAESRAGVATAAFALGALAMASTVGRLAGGWLLLKVPAHAFALSLMALQAAGLALLAVAADRFSILAGVVLFGITMGNSLMMHPLLLAERFGTRDYGRIYSASQLVTMVGVAGCPALVGVLYDACGGYLVPFLAVAAASVVGLAILGWFGNATGNE